MVPLSGIALRAFVTNWGEGVNLAEVATLDNFRSVFEQPTLLRGILNTVLTGVIGGGLAVACYTAIALATHRQNDAWSRFVDYLGLMFQSYALWPHKTVADNVAYGLKLRKVAAAETGERVHTALGNLGLGVLGQRLPHQLPGDQQQRVASARALWGTLRGAAAANARGAAASALVRLERVRLVHGPGQPGGNRLRLPLVTSMLLGDRWEHLFMLGATRLRAYGSAALAAGKHWLELPCADLWLF